jgi:hypothetical protein
MDFGRWGALDPSPAGGLLADVLTTISGATHRPRAQDTTRLAAALRAQAGKRTLHGCEITRHGATASRAGVIRIAREMARVAPPCTLSGHGTVQWDARFRVQFALPPGLALTLRALGSGALQRRFRLPVSTPSLWHLDALLFVPHIPQTQVHLPEGADIRIGFAPPKPLAAAPFWWLK